MRLLTTTRCILSALLVAVPLSPALAVPLPDYNTFVGLGQYQWNLDTQLQNPDAINTFFQYMAAKPHFYNEWAWETTTSGDPDPVGHGVCWSPSDGTIASWGNQTGDDHYSAGSGVTIVEGVNVSFGSNQPSTGGTFYQDVVNGTFDACYANRVHAWHAAGYNKMHWRIGWEWNGSWYPFTTTTPANLTAFVAAFRHISQVMKNACVADGMDCKIVWNPATIEWMAQPWADGLDDTSYPGDDVTDIIATDDYDASAGTIPNWYNGHPETQESTLAASAKITGNLWHYYTYKDGTQYGRSGSGQGMSSIDAIGFAQRHGKPFSMPESGAGGALDNSNVPIDNYIHVQWQAQILSQGIQAGVPVSEITQWNANDTNNQYDWFDFISQRPKIIAAWKRWFGGNSGGADHLLIALSEDKPSSGDLTFTATFDGAALPDDSSFSPVDIFHVSGMSKAYPYNGNWGSGQHTVCVTLTNPATSAALYVMALEYDGAQFAPQATLTTSTQQCFTVGGLGSTAPNQVKGYFIPQIADGGHLGHPNGVYKYSTTPSVPLISYNQTNYWVDLVFRPTGAGGATCATQSLFSSTDTPATIDGGADSPLELGVRFQPTVSAGVITGVKFYKASTNTGTHTVHLWTDNGTLMASATSTNEPASGWVTVSFATPVSVSPNTFYVASYHTDVGHYSTTSGYFASAHTSGSLTAPADAPRAPYKIGSPNYAE